GVWAWEEHAKNGAQAPRREARKLDEGAGVDEGHGRELVAIAASIVVISPRVRNRVRIGAQGAIFGLRAHVEGDAELPPSDGERRAIEPVLSATGIPVAVLR